jgi:hypothetical protein
MKVLKTAFTLFFCGLALQLFGQNPLVGTWERQTDTLWAIKVITPTHWMIFIESRNGGSHEFVRSHGGGYTLTANKYMEQLDVASWENQGDYTVTDYNYKVEGDKFFMSGTLILSDGTVTPIDEVWQKVKFANAYPNNPALGTWNQLSSTYTTPEGKKESHTKATATRFEIITPTHWMRISHRNNTFEHSMGGRYTLEGNIMYPEVDFASFPIDKSLRMELIQKVSGNKRQVQGKLTSTEGKMPMILEDVFEKVPGKVQALK